MEMLKPKTRSRISSLVDWLMDGYWPSPDRNHDLPRAGVPARTYTLQRLLAQGDVADIHLAGDEAAGSRSEELYVLKMSRVAGGLSLLDNERKTLAKLLRAAGDTTYSRYLPALAESLPVADRPGSRVNVFHYEPGFHTLEQVHEQHPALDGRHLAWIFKRLLTVLGFSHLQGTIHGAILPCHVMVDGASHGLQLVGWGQSVGAGQRIRTVPTRYRNWYPPEVLYKRPARPATDLFLAARCLIYLAGGNPVINRMSEAIPPPMQQFISTCLSPSCRMRPDDAWTLLEDFDDLLRRLYGPPMFHELNLT
jgi:serine/threonine protein kinase